VYPARLKFQNFEIFLQEDLPFYTQRRSLRKRAGPFMKLTGFSGLPGSWSGAVLKMVRIKGTCLS
jgi:hypothetical protein